MNLIVEGTSLEVVQSHKGIRTVVLGVSNASSIAESVVNEVDPCHLVTRKNRDMLLDYIGEDYVKEYFKREPQAFVDQSTADDEEARTFEQLQEARENEPAVLRKTG